jgi:hypothetical protein
MSMPTDPGQPAGPTPDFLISPGATTLPEHPSRRRLPRGLVAGAAALAMALVVGGAYAAGSYLSGGGTQPEQVLPTGAFAFVKVDLDPAANQKVAVYQLSRKFPDLFSAAGGSDRALKDSVVAGMLDRLGSDISYERDIKPWLGDRVALAAYPRGKEGTGATLPVTPVLAIQYTDEGKMAAAMSKIAKSDDEFGWATTQGYVVVSDGDAAAHALVRRGESSPLSDDDTFSHDVTALDGDQLAVAWVDIAGAAKASTSLGPTMFGAPALGLAGTGATATTGRAAFGVHADKDYLEVQGRTYGVSGGVAAEEGTGLAGSMPADSLAAVSATGLGKALTNAWSTFSGSGSDVFGLARAADELGLRLPDDFDAVFGTETAIGVSGDLGASPHVTIRSRGGDADRAKAIADTVARRFLGSRAVVEKTSDGFVVGDDGATVRASAKGDESVGGTATYRRAVPDAARASVVAFIDLGRVLDAAGDSEASSKLHALSAIGVTLGGRADAGEVRLRLLVR